MIRRRALPAVCLLLALPLQAQAHTTVEGLNEFTNGLIHPLFTPAHVLVLLAFGLWTSRLRPFNPRLSLAGFAGASFVGLAITMSGKGPLPMAVPVIVAVVAAAIVAADLTLPDRALLALTEIAGLILGLDSPADPGVAGFTLIKTLLGTWVGLIICFMMPAYYLSLLPERKWAAYGVRILASWIIAIAVMVLALSFRKG
ncbi:HupE/UreJ family protein [Luteolibacter sp. Populi]|uniref:HupE/UreJ family protein n=1 Tax=Luteolibacter sp. Populi TaxID=3230487 RepID=UPI0034679316